MVGRGWVLLWVWVFGARVPRVRGRRAREHMFFPDGRGGVGGCQGRLSVWRAGGGAEGRRRPTLRLVFHHRAGATEELSVAPIPENHRTTAERRLSVAPCSAWSCVERVPFLRSCAWRLVKGVEPRGPSASDQAPAEDMVWNGDPAQRSFPSKARSADRSHWLGGRQPSSTPLGGGIAEAPCLPRTAWVASLRASMREPRRLKPSSRRISVIRSSSVRSRVSERIQRASDAKLAEGIVRDGVAGRDVWPRAPSWGAGLGTWAAAGAGAEADRGRGRLLRRRGEQPLSMPRPLEQPQRSRFLNQAVDQMRWNRHPRLSRTSWRRRSRSRAVGDEW